MKNATAGTFRLTMLPGEKWWGLCSAFGREMPFTEATVFKCDLRLENYAHQSLSLLCSDRGRAIWCPEPVGATIAGGEIALESDAGEIALVERAGANLAEAFRFASRTWFPPTGEEPELLYFSAPQLNTWIELTYHQNERDILAYAQSMLDNGVPPGVFMIDDTWQHAYGEWDFDRRRFSDPKGMMDALHAMGYKVLLWMCPFVSMDSPAYRRIAFGTNPDDVRGYPAKEGGVPLVRKQSRRGRVPERDHRRRRVGRDRGRLSGGDLRFRRTLSPAPGRDDDALPEFLARSHRGRKKHLQALHRKRDCLESLCRASQLGGRVPCPIRGRAALFRAWCHEKQLLGPSLRAVARLEHARRGRRLRFGELRRQPPDVPLERRHPADRLQPGLARSEIPSRPLVPRPGPRPARRDLPGQRARKRLGLRRGGQEDRRRPLSLSGGLSFLNRSWNRDQNKGYAVNWVEFDSVEHDDKSTIFFWGPFWTNGSASSSDTSVTNCAKGVIETIPAGALATNVVTILHGISAFAAGPAGDPRETAAHPVVPWIAFPADSSSGGGDNLAFGAFDSDGRLVTPVRASVSTLADAAAAGANAILSDKNLAIASDVAVNSLFINNQNKGKTLGEGRTLTVSSGGLMLQGAAAVGTEAGGAANGALVLGDATHPAYVWARGKTSGPNQIWAPVTAPGGFVSAYTGNLVLGGNQTNILDELVVNAGSLTLGTATTTCRLAKNLPIRIYANATLKLPNADSTAGKILQFDGAAGWFGKVEVGEGIAAKCKKAFIRDYPESPDWETLPRGVYGSSASAATGEFVRDDLFAGSGTLEVVTDDRIQPTLMLLR